MPETQFFLQRVETRLGPLALVTIDNGEDYTKPTVFSRGAIESAQRVVGELESGDWVAMVLTGKPFVFAAGADITEFPKVRDRETAIEGSRAGHDLFAPHPRAALSDGRRDQRRLPRRRARDLAPLLGAHDLDLGAAFRLPGGVPRDHPRLGRHPARAAADRPGAGGEADRREPAAPEPDARRREGVRVGPRRPPARAGRVRGRVDRLCARARRERPARAAGARLVGARDGAAARANGGGRRRPRRRARAVRRARPDRGRRELGARGGLPARGGGDRRPDPLAPGAGVALRVRPRRAARQARRRDPRREAAPGAEGRDRRRRADGDAARDPLPAAPRGADRDARHRRGAGSSPPSRRSATGCPRTATTRASAASSARSSPARRS